MLRLIFSVILLGLFHICAASGSANSIVEYAEQLNVSKDIFPEEVRRFYSSLTTEDKNVLQGVLNKSSSYTNFSQVLGDLQNGSSTLYNKAVGVVSDLRETIASLNPPARKFVDDSASQIQKAMGEEYSLAKIRNEIQAVVDRYSALEESTKEELKKAFPIVSAVVYNSIFQAVASGLLGLLGSQSPAAPPPAAASEDIPPPIKVNK